MVVREGGGVSVFYFCHSFSRVYDAVVDESMFGEAAALENFDLSAEPYYILYGVGDTPAAATPGSMH